MVLIRRLSKEEWIMDLHARIGDEIVVDAMRQGEPTRKGEIVEVLGEADVAYYRVHWDDNSHVSIFFPGTTSHVVHTASTGRS